MHGWGWIQHATSTRVCKAACGDYMDPLPFGRFCHRGLDPSSFGSTLVLKFQHRPSPLHKLYSITAGGHRHSMGCAVGGGACGGAFNCAGPPLGNRCCACAQSGDLALEGGISSLTGSLPLGHEGRGQASPVVHSWQPRSKARGPG